MKDRYCEILGAKVNLSELSKNELVHLILKLNKLNGSNEKTLEKDKFKKLVEKESKIEE